MAFGRRDPRRAPCRHGRFGRRNAGSGCFPGPPRTPEATDERQPGPGHGLQGLRRERAAAMGIRGPIACGADRCQIAQRCGLTAEAVTWYESIFFNIRGRLKAVGYIRQHVIGAGIDCGFRNDELRAFWAWLTFSGQPAPHRTADRHVPPHSPAWRAADAERLPSARRQHRRQSSGFCGLGRRAASRAGRQGVGGDQTPPARS